MIQDGPFPATMEKFPPIAMLRIALPENIAAESVQWYAFDDRQILIDQGICAIESLPNHKSLQWILPASTTAGHLIPIPANAGRHQAALVDQILEDALLGSREDAHVVIAGQQQNGRLVWVCSRMWLSAWLEKWRAASRQPGSAYAIHDLLPPGKQAIAAHTAEGVIFRTPEGQTAYLEDAALLEQMIGSDIQFTDDLFTHPVSENAVSLLTGPFAPRNSARPTLSQFRRSAWLAGALVVTFLLGSLIHWQRMESREKNLKDEIRQTFAATFPGTPIIDPYLQWESMTRARNGSGANADALDQLARLATGLGGVRPRSAEFRDGAVRLVLTETDLVTARARLQQDGQEFNVSPAEPGFSRLDWRIKPQ